MMKKILAKIKETERITGMTIHENPYTYGSYVKDKNGKIVYNGDTILCGVFVQKVEKQIIEKSAILN